MSANCLCSVKLEMACVMHEMCHTYSIRSIWLLYQLATDLPLIACIFHQANISTFLLDLICMPSRNLDCFLLDFVRLSVGRGAEGRGEVCARKL